MLVDGVVVPYPAQTVELGHTQTIDIRHGDGVRATCEEEQCWANILITIAEANLTWIPSLAVKYERCVALCGEQVDGANLTNWQDVAVGVNGECGP